MADSESPQIAYKYEALPNPRSFRLLTLEPSDDTNYIKCEIKVLAMAEAPPYEALSYVWGSSDRTHTITCNGMPLKITSSLDVVLRVLQKPSESRILWIDQICINQDNLQERSEQVQIMRDIYSRARQALMWLGKDNFSQSSLAMDLIKKISPSYIRSFGRPVSFQFPADVELLDMGLPPRASPSWNALEKMLDLPYFTRIWIVQEIAVAKDVTVMWGDSEIPWRDVTSSCAAAYKLNLHIPDRSIINSSSSLSYFHILALTNNPVRPWVTLLHNFHSYYDATDPRDRVYALIGLVDDIIPLKPNYEMTTSEVYAQATIHVIKTSKNLLVLSLSHDESPISSSEFPSWAIGWRKNPDFISLSNRGMRASKESIVEFEEASDLRILKLGGFLFDSVEDISTPIKLNKNSLNLVKSFRLLKRNADKLAEVYGNGLIETFISTATAGSGWSTKGEGVRFGERQERMLRDCASYIANLVWREILKISTEGATPSCQGELLELLCLAVEADANMGLNQNANRFSQETRKRVKRLMIQYHTPNREANAGATELRSLVLELLNLENATNFEVAMMVNCSDRKFFITSHGTIGIGPQCLAPTDIICVLFGGETFYALRPIRDTGEHYLLGECYIHGFTNGEAMELYEQGEFFKQTFSLR